MNNIVVTLTMKLENDMSEKEIDHRIDQMILRNMKEVKLWTIKIEDKPSQYWEGEPLKHFKCDDCFKESDLQISDFTIDFQEITCPHCNSNEIYQYVPYGGLK